eukprot:Lankesteria_metandrocarpae@DN10776_c0_g1_i1.p1
MKMTDELKMVCILSASAQLHTARDDWSKITAGAGGDQSDTADNTNSIQQLNKLRAVVQTIQKCFEIANLCGSLKTNAEDPSAVGVEVSHRDKVSYQGFHIYT